MFVEWEVFAKRPWGESSHISMFQVNLLLNPGVVINLFSKISKCLDCCTLLMRHKHKEISLIKRWKRDICWLIALFPRLTMFFNIIQGISSYVEMWILWKMNNGTGKKQNNIHSRSKCNDPAERRWIGGWFHNERHEISLWNIWEMQYGCPWTDTLLGSRNRSKMKSCNKGGTHHDWDDWNVETCEKSWKQEIHRSKVFFQNQVAWKWLYE